MKTICNIILTVLFLVCCTGVHFGQTCTSKDTTLHQTVLLEPYLDFRPTWMTAGKQINFKKFNPNSLPIFCKIEHQIEKASKIGFRFRLGDLNYVNMLENKN
jgi:hypothetical protein